MRALMMLMLPVIIAGAVIGIAVAVNTHNIVTTCIFAFALVSAVWTAMNILDGER